MRVIDGGENGTGKEPFSGPKPEPRPETPAPPAEVSVPSSDQDAKLHLETGLPAPPTTIPATMYGEWAALMAHLKDARLLSDAILPVARSYLLAIYLETEAEKSITTDGVFVTGTSGAKKGNPAIALLRSSQGTIARLARQLGLGALAKRPSNDGRAIGDLFSDLGLR